MPKVAISLRLISVVRFLQAWSGQGAVHAAGVSTLPRGQTGPAGVGQAGPHPLPDLRRRPSAIYGRMVQREYSEIPHIN